MNFSEDILDKLRLMTDDEKMEFIQDNTLTSGGAARYLEISKQTLVRWDTIGKLKPDLVFENGYRFYFKWSLEKFKKGIE